MLSITINLCRIGKFTVISLNTNNSRMKYNQHETYTIVVVPQWPEATKIMFQYLTFVRCVCANVFISFLLCNVLDFIRLQQQCYQYLDGTQVLQFFGRLLLLLLGFVIPFKWLHTFEINIFILKIVYVRLLSFMWSPVKTHIASESTYIAINVLFSLCFHDDDDDHNKTTQIFEMAISLDLLFVSVVHIIKLALFRLMERNDSKLYTNLVDIVN